MYFWYSFSDNMLFIKVSFCREDIACCMVCGDYAGRWSTLPLRLRSASVGSKPASTGCCEPLLNACQCTFGNESGRARRVVTGTQQPTPHKGESALDLPKNSLLSFFCTSRPPLASLSSSCDINMQKNRMAVIPCGLRLPIIINRF